MKKLLTTDSSTLQAGLSKIVPDPNIQNLLLLEPMRPHVDGKFGRTVPTETEMSHVIESGSTVRVTFWDFVTALACCVRAVITMVSMRRHDPATLKYVSYDVLIWLSAPHAEMLAQVQVDS
jgi:hypothetical protein